MKNVKCRYDFKSKMSILEFQKNQGEDILVFLEKKRRNFNMLNASQSNLISPGSERRLSQSLSQLQASRKESVGDLHIPRNRAETGLNLPSESQLLREFIFK